MKKISLIVLFGALLTGCVQYSLVTTDVQTVKGITVKPESEWNKAPFNKGPNTEVWTKDGHALNELVFAGGVEDGKTIFLSRSKELPMPVYRKDMLPNEVVELIETSLKNFYGGDIIIETSNLRPQSSGDNIGFRFDLSYFDKTGLAKKGEVIAIPKGTALYVAIFTSASLHYHQKDAVEIDHMFSSLGV